MRDIEERGRDTVTLEYPMWGPSKQQGRPEEIRMLMREMFSLVTIPLCQCASIGLRGLSRTYIQLLLLEDIYYKRNFLASVLG